jgi:sialic acid synthase SpsE
VDDLVAYFANRGVPLALNHCVSVYPSEDWELDIAQVDFLKARYPDNVIGFSSHEKTDWRSSVMLAYAKGARTFERHVDVAGDTTVVSPYCSTPEQVDAWFKAWKKAVEMCGRFDQCKRVPSPNETAYLDSLVRGAWAARDLPAGHVLRHGAMNHDVRLQIPLLRGQLSCRELMDGESLTRAVKEGEPLMIDDVDGPHAQCPRLVETIRNRGLEK